MNAAAWTTSTRFNSYFPGEPTRLETFELTEVSKELFHGGKLVECESEISRHEAILGTLCLTEREAVKSEGKEIAELIMGSEGGLDSGNYLSILDKVDSDRHIFIY